MALSPELDQFAGNRAARRAVVEAILAAKHAFSADELGKIVRRRAPTVSPVPPSISRYVSCEFVGSCAKASDREAFVSISCQTIPTQCFCYVPIAAKSEALPYRLLPPH